jgi:hypothetical protein
MRRRAQQPAARRFIVVGCSAFWNWFPFSHRFACFAHKLEVNRTEPNSSSRISLALKIIVGGGKCFAFGQDAADRKKGKAT